MTHPFVSAVFSTYQLLEINLNFSHATFINLNKPPLVVNTDSIAIVAIAHNPKSTIRIERGSVLPTQNLMSFIPRIYMFCSTIIAFSFATSPVSYNSADLMLRCLLFSISSFFYLKASLSSLIYSVNKASIFDC